MVSPVTGKDTPGRRRSAARARQLLADFRRDSILQAAHVVFARHGYAETTVDLIAREAGVAKGTLYLYYPSKTALYSAAVIAGLRELAAETSRVLASGQPLAAVLRAFFETRSRYFEARLNFFRIYAAEAGKLGRAAREIRQEFLRLHETQVHLLQQAVAAAAASGAIRAVNARAVALAVFDLSHGLVVRRVRDGHPALAADLDDVLDLLWKGLLPP